MMKTEDEALARSEALEYAAKCVGGALSMLSVADVCQDNSMPNVLFMLSRVLRHPEILV